MRGSRIQGRSAARPSDLARHQEYLEAESDYTEKPLARPHHNASGRAAVLRRCDSRIKEDDSRCSPTVRRIFAQISARAGQHGSFGRKPRHGPARSKSVIDGDSLASATVIQVRRQRPFAEQTDAAWQRPTPRSSAYSRFEYATEEENGTDLHDCRGNRRRSGMEHRREGFSKLDDTHRPCRSRHRLGTTAGRGGAGFRRTGIPAGHPSD